MRISVYKALIIAAFAFAIFSAGCSRAVSKNSSMRKDLCVDYQHSLRISLLDVGQGEAILITCPDGQTQTLIDSGDTDEAYPNASSLFLEALLATLERDRTIELAINTHPHRDHLWGFHKLLRDSETPRIDIKHYIDNGEDNPESSLEERIRERIADTGGSYLNLKKLPTSRVEICPKKADSEQPIELSFLLPSSKERSSLTCPANLNDCSIVSKLSWGEFSFLFLADTTVKWEDLALQTKASRAKLKSTLMKVGHHGSHSTTDELLSAVEPQAALLSTGAPGVGTTERYEYPQLAVLRRLGDFFSPLPSALPSTISACEKKESGCHWFPVEAHERIWSTATSGSIDVYVKQSGFCLAGRKDGRELEVRF